MALVTLKEILHDAQAKGYAVGSFNLNGMDDAQGMVNGAVEKRSPIVLMVGKGTLRFLGLHQTAGMLRGMAEAADVPVCVHLDHATDPDLIKAAIQAGFSSVMIDASAKDFDENIQESRAIVAFAKDYNCSVEAELGKVGGKEEQLDVAHSVFTDPSDVPRFVAETGIDALALAFGSAHGFYQREPRLDFDVLQGVAAVTDCPLVLHGGTGIPQGDIRQCIAMGISKINVGTEFKALYTQTLREAVAQLPETEMEPRAYMARVREASARVVMEKIDLFGSANQV